MTTGMTAKQVMKILKKNGWTLARINSSHHVFEKQGFDRPVPVPYHKGKDSDLGNFAKQILREANIDPDTKEEIKK